MTCLLYLREIVRPRRDRSLVEFEDAGIRSTFQ